MVVALTVVAELGDLTRFDNPRQLAAFVGLVPSEYSSGSTRRQGGITKAGNGRARRVLVEAAWAYCHPAKVSLHIQQRIDPLPNALPDLGWTAQVRLCKRYRRLVAGQASQRRRHGRRARAHRFYVSHRARYAHARVISPGADAGRGPPIQA